MMEDSPSKDKKGLSTSQNEFKRKDKKGKIDFIDEDDLENQKGRSTGDNFNSRKNSVGKGNKFNDGSNVNNYV